jgi:Skp family chaperone for outer membrane proteins
MTRSVAARCVAAFVLLVCLASAPVWAEGKVAIANQFKILNDAQETKDFNKAIEAEHMALKQQEAEKVDKIKQLEAQRNQVKPDAPQYNELTKQIVQMTNDGKAWRQQADMELARKFRDHARKMYGKIDTAITDIAKAKGVDMVIAEQKPEVSDEQMAQLNPQQIIQVLFTRNILYKSASTQDLTQEVIQKLDAGYASGATTKP